MMTKDESEWAKIVADYEALRTLATAVKEEIKTMRTRGLMYH